jgi:uncharacterized protein (DUF2461 family)
MLANIRRHIATRPASLTRLLREPRFAKRYGGFSREDALKRPPKGYAADTPHIEAIKLRHYFGMIEVDIKKRPPKDMAADLGTYFRDLLPLMTWLRGAIQPERR